MTDYTGRSSARSAPVPESTPRVPETGAAEEVPDVLTLLTTRGDSASKPGRRSDHYRLVLAIEGGASRAVYSSGMALALSASGYLDAVDAVYGTSAGAMIGAWLLSDDPAAGLRRWSDPAAMRTLINPYRPLRGRPVVDMTDVLAEYARTLPGVFASVLRHAVALHPIATRVTTGTAEDLRSHIRDELSLQRALHASSTLPLLSGPPVELGGERWIDGGIAEDVPFATPRRGGATHVLLLRSRPEAELPRPPSRLEDLSTRVYLRWYAPQLLPVWRDRHVLRLEREHTIGDFPVLQIRPPAGSPAVGRLETSRSIMSEALSIGEAAFRRAVAAPSERVDAAFHR